MIAAAVPATLFASIGAAGASGVAGPRGLLAHKGTAALTANDEGEDDGGETAELLDREQEYAAVRTAPAATVSSQAMVAARAQAAALPAAAGAAKELTNQPYDSDALNYRDPTWSNSSGGSRDVSGRMTAITSDGNAVYAGAAGGGVWKSTDKGAHWTPVFDGQGSLNIGALAVDPADHSIWVGTGEPNSNADGLAGDGIYRSGDGGASWQLVGNRIDNSLVFRLTFDGAGHVFAATSTGLLERSTLDATAAWKVALKPDPNPDGSPYRTSWISDVKVKPGTGGKEVVAVLGWRGGTAADTIAYNGFYASHDGGATFVKVTPKGIAGATGRTSLDYGPDGALLAIVEDPTDLGMKGVYRSANGFAGGPWTTVATEDQLAHAPGTATGDPGAQAWYDQYVTVDPKDAKHIYVGLTEIYETSDGGRSWTTIGPYWNFGKACWSADPQKNTCPPTTHSDQHAGYVAPDGTAYFGNDGGMYSRPASLRKVVKWDDLNATLHTLQYYYAGVGALATGGDAVYGGLQDNGTSLLLPGASKMVSPFGGDGMDVIVDPANGKRAVNSYVYNLMARTENGGVSQGKTNAYTTITMTCPSLDDVGQGDLKPCDPNPRFVAPFEADQKNVEHWVAGGQMVWDNRGAGWSTVCTPAKCDWKMVHDLGAGAQTTALGVSGAVTYAGWCGNGCNPGGALPFTSGIDTNYGGSWHRISAPDLPNRIPTSFAVDPANAAHVYAVYGGFSRNWIPAGGVGHVFESTNGGASWKDVSGNLPDAPVNDVVLAGGTLVVATDVGVFTSGATGWSRVAGLPNVSTNDLAMSPKGDYVVLATHGRGMWTYGLEH